MLQVTNRFAAPMRSQNISKGRVQNHTSSVNFSGNRAGISIVSIFAVAMGAVGCLLGSAMKNNNLQSDIKPKVNATKMLSINHNSVLVVENKGTLPFVYAEANKYLQDVKDSLNGAKVEPFKKHNVANLLKKEELIRVADSLSNVARNMK